MSIETIAIVHHTHIDFGYTDHQQTCMRMHRAFVDEALDAIARTKNYPDESKFRWTQEVSLPLTQWWAQSSAKKRAYLLQAISNRQFEVCALPVNVTNFPDAREWDYMLSSLPSGIEKVQRPTAIMQNDINGISRRGLEMAYDRGVRMLWMGPNSYYGMAPSPAPFPFYWELSQGKRMLVWCNSSYNDGTFLFNDNWREGPVPAAHDLCYRNAGQGDIFAWDDESLKRSHCLLGEKLAQLTGGGGKTGVTDGFTKCKTRTDYPFKTLITSVTGQWRCDNDPPFPYLSDFVRAWNAKGLAPRLLLTTLTQALTLFAREAEKIPLKKGVWADYWANGLATSPAEMRCAREARRILTCAHMPMLGKFTPAQKKDERGILYNLMMFGEHSFAAWDSAADPFCPNARGQIAEKDVFPYRALEAAKVLLAERVRAGIHPEFGTITLINPTDQARVERVDIPTNAMRGDYTSLLDPRDERFIALYRRPGRGNFLRPQTERDFSEDNAARTFADVCADMRTVSEPIRLAAFECVSFVLSKEAADPPARPALPQVRTDANGWPVFLAFEGENTALVEGKAGDFCAIRAKGISPRWTYKDVFDADEYERRRQLFEELFRKSEAVYHPCERGEDRGQVIFTQSFTHPSLRNGRRTLTVDCLTRRAQLCVKIHRLADFTPEIFYVGFNACAQGIPTASLAGQAFTPGADNLPGTNKDFFAIDGCLQYGTNNKWCWYARDSALVCIGAPRPSTRADFPEDAREFHAQIFDNTWDTNFNPNAWGQMEFRFDISNGSENFSSFDARATPCIVIVQAKNK